MAAGRLVLAGMVASGRYAVQFFDSAKSHQYLYFPLGNVSALVKGAFSTCLSAFKTL
jgi:hypothetical protein